MSETNPGVPQVTRVSIAHLDVSFGRMVAFFIKAGFAAIPAIIVVTLSIGLIGAGLRSLFRFGLWGMHGPM